MVQYANNESIFYRVLGSLISDGGPADIVFFSHKNTQGRLELVANLATEKIIESGAAGGVRELHSHFKSLGNTRNFYAHARYVMTEGDLAAAIGVTFDNQSNQFRGKKVEFDKAGRHELRQCGSKFKSLNTRLIAFAHGC